MRVVFTEAAWDDFRLLAQDRQLLKRVNQLIADIQRGGYDGIGKPERLSGDLSDYWSRRIDDRQRLVYRIDEDGTLEIVQCWGHYSDR